MLFERFANPIIITTPSRCLHQPCFRDEPDRQNPGRNCVLRVVVTLHLDPVLCRKMADSGSVAAKRCDSGPVSSISMESISALTELEDLEKVYQQLCEQEVGGRKL